MPTKEGHWAVQFPDFEEAFTQGENLQDCMVMGQDILNITIEERTKARIPIPAPSDMETAKAWADKQKDDPDLADAAFLLQLFRAPAVDMTPVRVSVSFPKSTLEEIDAKAVRTGFTRSGFLAHAAQQYRA